MPRENAKGDNLSNNNVERAAEVFSTYGDFIRSTIQFRIKSEALCNDLFQDFFLYLVSKPIPDDVQNIKGFLFRVITDRIKDSVRSIARYRRRVQRYAMNHEGVVNERPEKELVDREEITKMFELIQKHLSTTEALAISLRHRNGYEIKEVAKELGVKSRSVSRYISIGLRKVRDHLRLEDRVLK